MSNNINKRPYRERRKREVRETISGRIPKKPRDRSGSNGSEDQREDGVVPEEKLLDPVAEARKALEMFEEVSGEPIANIIPKKNTIKNEVGQVYDEHKCPSKFRNNGRFPLNGKSANEGAPKTIDMKVKLEGVLRDPPTITDREEEVGPEERKKIEEEKARQNKRIEIGEARRREFRPKIAGVKDCHCLL